MAAIIAAAAEPDFGATVAAVLSDKPDAGGLAIPRGVGIPTGVFRLGDFSDRVAWNAALADAIDAYEPDLVVLAGFMKILAPETVARLQGRVINTHPALLPAFPGAHGVRDALAHGVKVTGCTVHLVDEGVDSGPIVAQAAVDIWENDTEETLHERIKPVERALVVQTIRRMMTRGWTVEGRTVKIPEDEVGS